MDLAEQSGGVTPAGVRGLFQPALVPLLVAIDRLSEDPDNARLHPEENLTALKTSLTTFAQTKPVVFREQDGDRIVVAGNGTLRAARELGWSHIAAVAFAGHQRLAAAYAIVDNRVPELATWDAPKLEAQLAELSQWSAEGLDWRADDAGLTPDFRESLNSPEPAKKRAETGTLSTDTPVVPEVVPETAAPIPYCTTCGGTETVCAPCVLAEFQALLADTDENLDRLASECWLTKPQAAAVLSALRGRMS